MNNLEEITVYPKNISNSEDNTFNNKKMLTPVCILIIIIAIIFIINKIFSPANNKKFKDELGDIEKYVADCNKGISYDQNSYTNINWQPKISIIIPIYNASKLIDVAYKSILNQSFKKVEIIFINDLPSNYMDNDMINVLKENDKRIVLIKNKKNRGSFYSRNRGALLAKGKYIQFLDADDLLVNNILEKTFNVSEKDNLDVVQYPYVSVFRSGRKRIRYLGTTKGIVYQPELKDIMCYEYGELIDRLHKYMLWDKLIKKDVFINALKYLGEENVVVRFAFADDTLSAYAITNVAQSYTYLNEPGYYYYVVRNGSITEAKNTEEKSNLSVKYPFKIIKIIFDKAEDNAKSKRKALCFFRHFYNVFWSKTSKFLLDDEALEVMNSVVNSFVNSMYIDDESKDFAKEKRKEIYAKIDKLIDDEVVEKSPNILNNTFDDDI